VAVNKPKHILVIRLSAMGDVAMLVPVLNALIQQHPNVKVTVLTKRFLAPIILEIPTISVKIAEIQGNHKGIFGLWRLSKELKELGVDGVADMHNVLRSNILKWFLKFSPIPFYQVNKGRKEKKQLTAPVNKKFVQLKTTHVRYQEVFKKLGFLFKVDKNHVCKKENQVSTAHLRGKEARIKYIGIAPFAAFKGKAYPPKKMEEVLNNLSEFNNYKVFLFGGGAIEKSMLEVWEQQFKNCQSVAGKMSLKEELAAIASLDLMVAMDSGNAHLAAMYGIPTITLWGVTHPYAGFAPFGQDSNTFILSDRSMYPLIPTSIYGNKVPKGYENVMDTITPEVITRKIIEIINN